MKEKWECESCDKTFIASALMGTEPRCPYCGKRGDVIPVDKNKGWKGDSQGHREAYWKGKKNRRIWDNHE